MKFRRLPLLTALGLAATAAAFVFSGLRDPRHGLEHGAIGHASDDEIGARGSTLEPAAFSGT